MDRSQRDIDEEQEDKMIELYASRGETYHTHGDQIRVTGRVIKRLRELTKTIDEHGRATSDLTERVRKLTVWLLWVTIAIGAMTVVQAFAAWKVLTK